MQVTAQNWRLIRNGHGWIKKVDTPIYESMIIRGNQSFTDQCVILAKKSFKIVLKDVNQ